MSFCSLVLGPDVLAAYGMAIVSDCSFDISLKCSEIILVGGVLPLRQAGSEVRSIEGQSGSP